MPNSIIIIFALSISLPIIILFTTEIMVSSSLARNLGNTTEQIDGSPFKWNQTEAMPNVSGEELEGIIVEAGYTMLIVFFIIYILVGVWGRRYLTSKPSEQPPKRDNSGAVLAAASEDISEAEKNKRRLEMLQSEYKSWEREQDFSTILAGFTVSGLVFILAIEKATLLQRTIEFLLYRFCARDSFILMLQS
jgi:hypothetical protein